MLTKKFIIFEGVDYSGKSFHSRKIAEYIKLNYKYKVTITREPGGNNLDTAEEIRNIFIKKRQNNLLPLSQLLLIYAARSENYSKIIIPSLKNNNIVISDRFIYSTIAYQHALLGIDLNIINSLNDYLLNPKFLPDIIFILDIDYTEMIKRQKNRINSESNRYEDISEKDFNIIRNSYKDIAQKYPNVIFIDAKQSIENIQDIIKNNLFK